jgi:Tol biopolymer transport system component
MIDERELLRQASEAITPPIDPVERLVRRRGRKRRNQRIGAAVLALVVALVGIGTAIRVLHLANHTIPAYPTPSVQPAYHHNGELIVLTERGLIAVDPVTGAQRTLLPGFDVRPPPTPSPSCTWNPAVSPDGTRLAYATTRCPDDQTPSNDRLGIHILDLRTGRAKRVFPCRPAFCASEGSWVAWSPNGSLIAFAEGGRITLMNPDGSAPRVLIDMGDKTDIGGRPAWSPDGRRIAFSTDSVAGGTRRFRLLMVGVDGSGLTAVVERNAKIADGGFLPEIDVADPAWSPDGSTIAYWALGSGGRRYGGRPSGPGQVWVVRPDGSGRKMVFQAGPGCLSVCGAGPVWSPDGTKIAFLAPENNLYVMDADGSDPRRIVSGPEGSYSLSTPVWQPVP